MALEYRVTEVPEGLESHYKKDGNGFVLDVNGAVDTATYDAAINEAESQKKKVSEFRDTNITLRKQIEGKLNTGEETPPNIDELVSEAIDSATKDMKARLDKLSTERETLSSQLEEVVLSDRVKDIALKYGVFETALPDIVARAKTVFCVEDGKPAPIDKKVKDEEGNMYTPESWLKKLEVDAPHLFKQSSGSGARRPVATGRGPDTRSATDKIAAGLNLGNKPAKNVM